MTQMPKSKYYQCLTVIENMWGCFKCLFASTTPRTAYQLWMFIKLQCSVGIPIIIPGWFLLKLSSTPALSAESLWRMPLAWLCPYSCFVLVQPLIMLLVTLAYMPRAGWRPISGCEESCLACTYRKFYLQFWVVQNMRSFIIWALHQIFFGWCTCFKLTSEIITCGILVWMAKVVWSQAA
jgi:hypothetical protein